MGDTRGMRRSDRVGHGDRELQRLAKRHTTWWNQPAHGLAGHKFHHEHITFFHGQDVVNDHDVGVVQGAYGAGFGEETPARLLITQAAVHDLERDIALQSVVARPPDFARTA